jgi:hypothetical protein
VCLPRPARLERLERVSQLGVGSVIMPLMACAYFVARQCLSSGHRSQLSRDIVHTLSRGVSDGHAAAGCRAVLVEGRSKSAVARDYGVSRRWVITLVKRYLAEGDPGLDPPALPECPDRRKDLNRVSTR